MNSTTKNMAMVFLYVGALAFPLGVGAFLVFAVAPATTNFVSRALYTSAGCFFGVMVASIIIETIKRIRRKNEKRQT